jgi:2'-5' RNA ligase
MTFRQFLVNEAKKHKRYDYSSTQVNVPEKLAREVLSWSMKNIPNSWIFRDPSDPGFGREKEIHVTVLYGLHDEKPDRVIKLLKECKSFACKLGKVTTFNNPSFDVLKIDVESQELHDLNKLIKENLPSTNSYPVYKPHATIAYLRKGKVQELKDNEFFVDKEFTANEIIFSSRNGMKYKIGLQDAVEV